MIYTYILLLGSLAWSVFSFGAMPDSAKIEKKGKFPLEFTRGDSYFRWDGKVKIENFYGKATRLLNPDPADQVIIPGKHTFDLGLTYAYGLESYLHEVFKLKMVFRTKATWGAPESIAATDVSNIKDLEVVYGPHNHTINRNIFWLREAWTEMTLADVFGIPVSQYQTLTLGFFPFELGRGIALGSSYATDPDGLGYYSANAVDQYAPGFKLSGPFIGVNTLRYDFYAGILLNRSDTFEAVNAKILGNQIEAGKDRRRNAQRGFGVLNYILATRLQWRPWTTDGARLLVEPYGLFDDEREQKIEVVGDATHVLGTIGLALEGEYGNWEFGFDVAKNFGHQKVKAWDRNIIKNENRNGSIYVVNSQVKAIKTEGPDIAGKNAVYVPANQAIIFNSPQGFEYNGKQIGESNLRSSDERFIPDYQNAYRGAMFVADFAYWWAKPQLKLAAGAGVATGDHNPNRDVNDLFDSKQDADYKGFISLQETYSGSRVRSSFLLSGSGKIPRAQSFASNTLSDRFASTTNRFTNIVFAGVAAHSKLCHGNHTWNVNPNLLNYWQHHGSYVFDEEVPGTGRHASKWLGIEANIFVDVTLMSDMKAFLFTALFFPGTHYSDIKGRPLSKDQQVALDQADQSGVTNDNTLLVGNAVAFFFNLGFEYKY